MGTAEHDAERLNRTLKVNYTWFSPNWIVLVGYTVKPLVDGLTESMGISDEPPSRRLADRRALGIAKTDAKRFRRTFNFGLMWFPPDWINQFAIWKIDKAMGMHIVASGTNYVKRLKRNFNFDITLSVPNYFGTIGAHRRKRRQTP